MNELSNLYKQSISEYERRPQNATRHVELSPVPLEEKDAVVDAIVDGLIANIEKLEFDTATTTVSELMIGKKGIRHPASKRSIAVAALEGRPHEPKRMHKVALEIENQNTKMIPEIYIQSVFRIDPHTICQAPLL